MQYAVLPASWKTSRFHITQHYVVYDEAYGRGNSISQRQRTGPELQCLSSTLPLCYVQLTDIPRPQASRWSSAVEANNVLHTGVKSAILNCLAIAVCHKIVHDANQICIVCTTRTPFRNDWWQITSFTVNVTSVNFNTCTILLTLIYSILSVTIANRC